MLQVYRYQLHAAPRQRVELPAFAGSVIRGTWGAALREMVCVTNAPHCEGCPLASHCVYKEVFDPLPPGNHALARTGSIPTPYVLQLPQGGGSRTLAEAQPLIFGVTLIGAVRRHLPLLTLAFQKALAAGWLKQRSQFDLLAIDVEQPDGWTRVLSGPGDRLADHAPSLQFEVPVQPLTACSAVRIELLTPCRIHQKGKPLGPAAITPRAWLMALVRRAVTLLQIYGAPGKEIRLAPLVEAAEACRFGASQLEWGDVERYSGRQQSVMPMGGLLGWMEIHGPLTSLLPFLTLGEYIHNGKHASFGMGAYTVGAAQGANLASQAGTLIASHRA